MSDYIEQTSASDRYEAARKALAEYEEALEDTERGIDSEATHNAINALRALVTPPGVHEREEQIAERIVENTRAASVSVLARRIALAGIRAGIQHAHETWEPEVALRPTQEQMLRWLEIEHAVDEAVGMLFIPAQYIDREDD